MNAYFDNQKYEDNKSLRQTLPKKLQGPNQTIRHMNRKDMKFEYDLWGTRLHPWENMPAPFGGAWCVVSPGTYSLPHQHEEREMFICVEGEAEISLDGEKQTVAKGDLIAIPPETEHFIDNTKGSDDFHFFTVWWDVESAKTFLNEMPDQVEREVK